MIADTVEEGGLPDRPGLIVYHRISTRFGRRMTLALGTLALGMGLFALFFGLVAACDRL
jgi:hypothetical protein